MFLSIAFAAVGVAGALYSFSVAVLGLQNGPLCKVLLIWTTPFKNRWVTYLVTFLKFPWKSWFLLHADPLLRSDNNYLTDDTWWGSCTEPKNIVQFNIGLFATLLATSSLEVILCAIQMINGLFGCLCGTCTDKGVRWSWARDRNENTFSCVCCADTLIQTLLRCRILTSHLFFVFVYMQPLWFPDSRLAPPSGRLRAVFTAAAA